MFHMLLNTPLNHKRKKKVNVEPVSDQKLTLRKKCHYLEFFWSVFLAFGLNTQYSVRMRENTDQKNSEYRQF